MSSKGYLHMSWGFLFVMLSFRIGGFDILPDFIGFILFIIGLSKLSHDNEWFQSAKVFAWISFFLSFATFYEFPETDTGNSPFVLNLMLGLAQIILLLIMVYRILKGVEHEAIKKEQQEMIYIAQDRWTQFLTVHIATFFLIFVMFIPIINLLAVVGMIIWMIVVIVMIMKFMNKCEDLL